VLGTGYQQEVALDRLYADVAEYNQMVCNPAQRLPWLTWPSGPPTAVAAWHT
jgi:hypothetical protein